MMGPTHAAFAAVSYAPLAATQVLPWWGIGAAVAGGLLPDLCQPRSTISRAIPVADDVFRWYYRPQHRALNTVGWALWFALVTGLLAAGGTFAVLWWVFIREAGESVWWALWLSTGVGWVTAAAVLVGYVSHIVGDWLFDGSKWWAPHTNGRLEKAVRPVLMVVLAVVVVLGAWVQLGVAA